MTTPSGLKSGLVEENVCEFSGEMSVLKEEVEEFIDGCVRIRSEKSSQRREFKISKRQQR